MPDESTTNGFEDSQSDELSKISPNEIEHSPDFDQVEENAVMIESADHQPLSVITHSLQRLSDTVNRLGQDFETKLKYDQSKDRIIDQLHAELQEYRADLHLKLLEPLVMDLIALYDDLGHISQSNSSDETIKLFEAFQQDIVEMLARNGIETFVVEGEQFQSREQRAVRTVTTQNIAQNGEIAQRLRIGFRYDTRILRPEHVAVYKYASPQNDPAQSDEDLDEQSLE